MRAHRVKSAATTNSTLIKAGKVKLLGFELHNNDSAAHYFKFYDKATAPTVGTDTPAFTIGIPAGVERTFVSLEGIVFENGLGYGITAAVADNDTTATSADDVHGVIHWK